MADKKRMITTRSLARFMAPAAPDPETRPKPILSNKLKLRSPDIMRKNLPKAIDRSGEKKVVLSTHVHLAPEEPGPEAVPETVIIARGKPGTADKAFAGQPAKPAAKARAGK